MMGWRLFRFTVANGLGDEAMPEIAIPDDRCPDDYRLQAIARARAILPAAKPWKVRAMVELPLEAESHEGLCWGCGQPIPDGHRSMCPACREQYRLMQEVEAVEAEDREWRERWAAAHREGIVASPTPSPAEERQADAYPWECLPRR